MYYVYILKSINYNEIYTGSTNDLKRRLVEHNNGNEISTKRYKPWRLIYYEAFSSEKDAREREMKLKYHGNATRELKKRIKHSLENGAGLPRTVKNGAGFTLIELLITITIITLLFSIGMAQYNKFNRRQILVKAKDELVSNLRLAQGKSLAAEKPTTCTATLAGHKVKFTDNSHYKIVAVCGNEVDVKTDLSLPTGVTKQSVPSEIFFRVLSQGSPTDSTLTLQGFGETEIITVTTSGEIK